MIQALDLRSLILIWIFPKECIRRLSPNMLREITEFSGSAEKENMLNFQELYNAYIVLVNQ